MNVRPSILCPVDFSNASAGALRHAATIAERFATRLIVLTVEDPLLTESSDLGTGVIWSPEASREELERFARETFPAHAPALQMLEYEVAVGRPASEILRVARERSCDLIVISTHGLTGMRKLFFGSTTERVLRDTAKPVLVTPVDPGALRAGQPARLIRRILVPVDLTAASRPQTTVATRLADLFGVPVILVHVIEPVKTRLAARLHLAGLEADRRAAVEEELNALQAAIPAPVHAEVLVAYGDPAEELVKVARDRQAGLIVMGLHGSAPAGPRMGSVTYRLICLSPGLVLALPPGMGAETTYAGAPSAVARSRRR